MTLHLALLSKSDRQIRFLLLVIKGLEKWKEITKHFLLFNSSELSRTLISCKIKPDHYPHGELIAFAMSLIHLEQMEIPD